MKPTDDDLPNGPTKDEGISLRDVGVVDIALAVFAIITSIVIGMIYLLDLVR
jgi:hypothetical protein